MLLLKCGYNRRSLRWVGCNFWWGAWWLLAALRGNNGLGRFEFAFYLFIYLYFIIMVEKSGFVLELCTFNFVLDYTFTFIYLFFLSWVFLCILRSPLLVWDVGLLYYLMRKNVVCLLYEGEAKKVVLGGREINKKIYVRTSFDLNPKQDCVLA